MPSFPNKHLRWPADQAAVLYSLFLYDQNLETNLSKEPIKEWSNYMKKYGTDSKTGLHISEVTGGTNSSNTSRGCTLS